MTSRTGIMMLPTLLVLLCFAQLCQCKEKDKFFDEVPKELRCSGCELTVKVLDRMLGMAQPDNAHHLVDLALKSVCDKKRFSISEYNPDLMLKTCNFVMEHHTEELKRELIKHYRKPNRSTYIELSQQICLNIMSLCPGTAHKMPQEKPKADTPGSAKGGIYRKPKGGIPDNVHIDDPSFDQFKHFMKVSGHEAKLANPIPESPNHDEL